MLNVLDLFSGIGGFSLGLESTGGFKTVAFCEIDRYCQRVLAKQWPGVRIYDDIRTLTATALRRDGIAIDVIAGGFPCQDLSHAGKRVGIEGARSGLWSEYARLIGELRPRYAIVENVTGLLSLGMGTVLGDLAEIGFDAVWDCVPACAVGAPHRRDRVWLVAYPGRRGGECARGSQNLAGASGAAEGEGLQRQRRGHAARHRSEAVADAHRGRQQGLGISEHRELESACGDLADGCGSSGRWSRPDVADASGSKLQIWSGSSSCRQTLIGGRRLGDGSDAMADASEQRLPTPEQEALLGEGWRFERRAVAERGWWGAEPDVGRVAHGVPARVDRLKSLGNAVVPQIPKLIGEAIIKAEEAL
jgi:DNA (cytosine-5)-methyltransferase 1